MPAVYRARTDLAYDLAQSLSGLPAETPADLLLEVAIDGSAAFRVGRDGRFGFAYAAAPSGVPTADLVALCAARGPLVAALRELFSTCVAKPAPRHGAGSSAWLLPRSEGRRGMLPWHPGVWPALSGIESLMAPAARQQEKAQSLHHQP